MPPTRSSASALVVLVEDDADNLDLMTLLLEGEGFRVRGFSSAEGALENIGDAAPCALVTDMSLPGLNGADLVRRLREHPKRRGLNAFALTGFCKTDVEAAAPFLFASVFRKPVDVAALVAALRACVPAAALPNGDGAAFHSL